MIAISLSTAILLYSGILIALAITIWIYAEVSTQRSRHVMEKQFLWRCVFCAYVYLDESAQQFSSCPRCGSYNSVDDHGAKEVRPRKKKDEHTTDHPHGDERQKNTSKRSRPGQRRRGPRRRGR